MLDKILKIEKYKEDYSDYIKIKDLKDKYSYKIFARNAYVGIWIKEDAGFLISRYKVGKNPYTFIETHCDVDVGFEFGSGTAKPVEIIEKCPFPVPDDHHHNYDCKDLLSYLDNLEIANPIIEGDETPIDRRNSAIRFEERLRGGAHNKANIIKAKELGHPFHVLESCLKLQKITERFMKNKNRQPTIDELCELAEMSKEVVIKRIDILEGSAVREYIKFKCTRE